MGGHEGVSEGVQQPRQGPPQDAPHSLQGHPGGQGQPHQQECRAEKTKCGDEKISSIGTVNEIIDYNKMIKLDRAQVGSGLREIQLSFILRHLY